MLDAKRTTVSGYVFSDSSDLVKRQFLLKLLSSRVFLKGNMQNTN